MGDETLEAVGRGCPNLQYLYLLGNKRMTLAGLERLSKGCPILCGIDICGPSTLTQDDNLPMIIYRRNRPV